MNDTIAAIATASGQGGVGIVRISGPDAVTIAEAVVGKPLPDRMVVYGIARDVDGARLDDVVAFAMRAPRSFTGEHVAEIQGHGGPFNVARLLRAVLARGARTAEAGEFTRRAFENGRIDLARAEALRMVIGASSERALRVAQAQLSGAVGQAVAALRARALGPLVEIEAACDFPDEDLAVRDATWLVPELRAVAAEAHRLADTYRTGRVLDRGIEVALAGPVNTGKSSLFNALLGHERAIVAPEPGTTRDYVEAQTMWDGVRVTLVDTAGLRSDAGAVETRGIELGQQRTAAADVVLVVAERGTAFPDAVALASLGHRAVLVQSKCDELAAMGTALTATTTADAGAAGSRAARTDGTTQTAVTSTTTVTAPFDATHLPIVNTSATTGAGLADLRAAVLTLVHAHDSEGSELLITSERQQALLRAAGDHMAAAASGLLNGQPMEMIALDVREGLRELADVVGSEVGESVLDQLFARFCIGK